MVKYNTRFPRITVSPRELCALMWDLSGRDVPGASQFTDYDNDQKPTAVLGTREYALAVTIVSRESGGISNAYNDEGNSPRGSIDRGLWQWNNHWNPDVSDVEAYDPIAATIAARDKTTVTVKANPSGGATRNVPWRNWSPWKSSGQITAPSPAGLAAAVAWQATPALNKHVIADAALSRLKQAGFDRPVGKVTIERRNPQDVLGDAVGDFAGSIGSLVGVLLDPDWWRRIGVAVLGVGVLVFAVALWRTGGL